MTEDKKPLTELDDVYSPKREQEAEPTPQGQAAATAQPEPRVAPGRRPLFRT